MSVKPQKPPVWGGLNRLDSRTYDWVMDNAPDSTSKADITAFFEQMSAEYPELPLTRTRVEGLISSAIQRRKDIAEKEMRRRKSTSKFFSGGAVPTALENLRASGLFAE